MMKASYKKLWKLLVDKEMSKSDLHKATGLSSSTMTKLRRSEDVSMEALRKICIVLDCNIADIVEFEKENKYEVSGKNLKNFLDMIDSGEINEAENILLDSIDYTDRNEVMAAALFYQYLSEKDSEFLKNNNYTKEEVMSGFKQLLMQSGYTDLLCLVKAEE